MCGKIVFLDPYQGEYSERGDLVLMTHSHSDHCDPSKIARVRKQDTLFVAPADCASRIGHPVTSLKPGDMLTVGEIKIQAVEAYNVRRFRAPGVPFHPKGLGVGYLMSSSGKTVYHAGDTDLIPEMKSLHDVQLALLPAGGTFTMDLPEAAEAAIIIGPEYVLPMHYSGTTSLEAFRKTVEAKSKTKVVSLNPEKAFEF